MLPLAPLLAVAVVLVGTYTFLPPLVGWMVARNVQEGLGLEERPRVELESDPPPEMLAGKFSGGQLSLGSTDLGGVRAERVVVDLDPFDVDLLRSVVGGALRSEEPLSGTLRAEVSEGEISRLAKADVPVRGVELEEGRVLVRSEASVLDVEVPVSVQGSLALRGETLVFEPWRLAAFGVPVSERITEQLFARTEFAYPLGELPYGVKITGVEVAEDRLVLFGEMERIPIGGGGG
ncbi:MAG: DUF2993 domain-containing protein [Actinomycetota bacterium]|nr:DUF2993 domain-containing protein [Actinomycetota bacterium]